MAQALVHAARQAVAEGLDQLHQDDQHHHHGEHHLGHEALVAVADAEVAEAAAADGPDHRREADQRHHRQGEAEQILKEVGERNPGNETILKTLQRLKR